MQQIIAEQIDPGTGDIRGARTVLASEVRCVLEGNELVTGVIRASTDAGGIVLKVSDDERDYQRARIYDADGNLRETLQCREGTVVYAEG